MENQSRFAVEHVLDANRGGDWRYGKVCSWIDGARVGDFELGTSLRDFLFSIERLRCERGRRNNARDAAGSVREQILRLGECDDALDEACKQVGGQLHGQDR